MAALLIKDTTSLATESPVVESPVDSRLATLPQTAIFQHDPMLSMQVAPLDTEINVVEVNSRAAFMQLADEWNGLVHATRDQPFYRHEMIRIWLDNFAPDATLRVLTGRNSQGRLVAVLPLVEQCTRILGAPVRALVSAANDHSPRFDMVAEDGMRAGQVFFDYLQKSNTWDMLLIKNVPHAGHAWQMFDAAIDAGCPTSKWDAMNSPYFALPATRDEMQKQLNTKFKANVRRRRKKLEEKGCVTIEKVTGGLELPHKLEEGILLEQSGWKGKAGTAIGQSRETWGFYSELAHFAAHDGCLSLYTMRLDGRPVAFQYNLSYGSTCYLLKPAYDEALKECSPGQLLMDEVVSRSIDEGLQEFDFLGPDMEWKRDWTDLSRRHTWLYIFRDSSYGHFLHRYRFQWARKAKQVALGLRGK